MRVNRNFHIAVIVATVIFFICFQTAVAKPPERHQHRYRVGNLELAECMNLVEDLQAQIEELQSMLQNPAPVPRTGQELCWGDDGWGSWYEIYCEGTRQDGDLKKGVAWPDTRFTNNGDGTVTDNLTGLIWLKNANCAGERKNFVAAMTFANSLYDGWTGDGSGGDCGLEDGSVAGDWRLPNINELLSLIDYGNEGPAIPSGHPFDNVESEFYYRSSTASLYFSGYFWVVRMWYGHTTHYSPTIISWVWPVRDGK